MAITTERLQKMTPEQRATLHENARRWIDNGGREIIELIESSGLPLSSGGMRLSDPVYQRMEEIVWPSEGKKASAAATEAGLPALAGVEPTHSRAPWRPLLSAQRWNQKRRWDRGRTHAFSRLRTCRPRGHACRIGGENCGAVETKERLNTGFRGETFGSQNSKVTPLKRLAFTSSTRS